MSASNGYPAPSQGLLADRFPLNSLQQLTLQTGESVSGRVYCTDEATGSIVLQKELVHTTLASEIRIISVASVTQSETLPEDADAAVGSVAATPLTQPLPKIQKKALEERERRAIRLAEESLRHINQKASPIGQAVFDRLLKACGEVVWKDDTTSILVLNQIQVDEPYQPDNCEIVGSNGAAANSKPNSSGPGNGVLLEDGSLDRVKKIVAAVTADAVTNPSAPP